MYKRILICSGKGGVGKSTLTVGLARALVAAGKRVLLVDCDVGLRTLDLLTGLGTQAVYTWADVLDETCTSADAILADETGNLALLVPPQGAATVPEVTQFSALLETAMDGFDCCLLDAPAGIDGMVQVLYTVCDAALVVATPDPVSARAAGVLADLLYEKLPESAVRLIINRFDYDRAQLGEILSADEMVTETAVRLLGAVPEDINLQRPGKRQKRFSESGAAFGRLAQRLLGKEVPFQAKKVKSVLF